jgi:glycosyltransferase involved in cell wall biosynthesis
VLNFNIIYGKNYLRWVSVKVCAVVEGTYPYVTGGVSTWLQILMENLPEIEFSIYHLAPDSREREVKYEIPRNVSSINVLNIFSEVEWRKNRKKVPGNYFKSIYESVLFNQSVIKIASAVADIMRKSAGMDVISEMKSDDFWNVLTDVYNHFFEKESFIEYYWTMRNLILPFLNSFQFVPEKCDVYHSMTTGYASLVAISGKLYHGKKLVITEHGIYHREREREILTSTFIKEIYKKLWIGFFKVISAVSYHFTDKLVTLFEKNQLFQLELGADKRKMMIIPNGVDVNKYDIPKESHPGYVVGFVGRISKIKDLKTAIKAIRIVYDKIPDLRFIIVGPVEDEEYEKELLAQVEVLGLKGVVEFLGPQDTTEYYPKIDVLLLSSVSEGQPLVILEAMANGTPIVTTDVGGCSEMVERGSKKAGFVVKPKDYISMAKALIKLYDKDLREEMGKAGKEIVRKYYSLDRMIESYRKLYEDLST